MAQRYNDSSSSLANTATSELRPYHDWVAAKLGFRESTAGWRNMILERAGDNETEAFQLFFRLLDEYQACH
ncbi:MAG: hypothetical protein CMJ58_10425 [Planctomycetaceae bacterium]|nr:hypothetical protein [Planctomycetaceae bacterium]